MPKKIALVCGATQGIGLAFIKELIKSQDYSEIFVAHRASSSLESLKSLDSKTALLSFVKFSVEDESSFENIATLISKKHEQLDLCINFIGTLNDERTNSERSLKDTSIESSLWSFKVNTLPSLMLAKYLKELLRKSESSVFAAVSAKVGIISDNHLGGWYSYRSSKAALNMVIKNIAIEFKRSLRNCSVFAIHPGTTETGLSENFLEAARKKYTIHSPESSAENIFNIIKDARPETHTGLFYNWDGKKLPW